MTKIGKKILQEGCCLNEEEWNKLATIAPNAIEKWMEEGKGETLRHPLSKESNWFLLIGGVAKKFSVFFYKKRGFLLLKNFFQEKTMMESCVWPSSYC